MEDRIKNLYNEAWKIYKQYLLTHDIAEFTDNASELVKKYGHDTDACYLMIWWSARVQGLHDSWLRVNR